MLSLGSSAECDVSTDFKVIRDAVAMENLSLLASASSACADAARPFLCQFIFVGVCDEEGNLYQPTFQECNELENGDCKLDFYLAKNSGFDLLYGFDLPDCSTLPSFRPNRNCRASYGSGQASSSEYLLMYYNCIS